MVAACGADGQHGVDATTSRRDAPGAFSSGGGSCNRESATSTELEAIAPRRSARGDNSYEKLCYVP